MTDRKINEPSRKTFPEERSNEYQCADCGEIYPRGWSDEEASAEFAHEFPGHDLRSAVIICDDCFRKYVVKG